jgi:hypothetical protein
VTVNECDQQETDCNDNAGKSASSSVASSVVVATTTATSTGAQILSSVDANFFYFCDS